MVLNEKKYTQVSLQGVQIRRVEDFNTCILYLRIKKKSPTRVEWLENGNRCNAWQKDISLNERDDV